MFNGHKVGLVLSGGGAKGAYQAGVVKALAELKVPVHAIAGASIGALNGAVLASATDIVEGGQRLEAIWQELASDSPLKQQTPSYFRLLIAAGLRENILIAVARTLVALAQSFGVKLPAKVHEVLHAGVMDDAPLKALLDKYIDHEALSQGADFYVSVYKSFGGLADLSRFLIASTGLMDSRKSEFVHLQSKTREERQEYLLASAALPAIFSPRQVGNSLYTDGGQGGWSTAQGNTPIQPLLDAGCSLIVVTHLSDGSLWDRHDYPGATIIEIRPQSDIATEQGLKGALKDLLGFDSDRINKWMQQGYDDSHHCLGEVHKALLTQDSLRLAEQARLTSEQGNLEADQVLSDALNRLR